ncbi:dolichyl-diphosphooligosaccharide---protein glycosyltransferase subunit 1 (ribophorin I) [Marchantia polymorpha subsp. ruderalis]|uniref:Dolichyl-diphosphooligosaccharide--protein glycosyltransferase subunit 1 n=2 Tax=Marchantia polymorpha TaxID=3197 RepID=A0A176W6K3_MARPO|nr:hypothetical protein AXG93_4476s1080 [Marchantia polymorpha subsp. ruderalis]PTQ47534.1 hypothetical protein MARPO_0008s0275 [Marchantia polymorpha]BBN19307.1 hypothetical protein Mp_8g09530 [Marchantia polymorpha subsp. ruderalis]|eukprot:PTQ47534.1 hypothetical protein MARPO_0008s0275 [Marchantia polymorpha]
MASSMPRSLLSVSSLLCLFFALACAAPANLVLTKVDRKIDLSSQIVRSTTQIRVENKGSDPASELLLALNSAQAKSLSYLRVTTSEGKGKSKSQAIVLRVLPAEAQSPANVTFYSVQLPKSLNKGETVALDIYSAFTHLLTPYPVEIGQSDVQLVLFHDSAHFLSPYPVKVQATAMKVPSFRVESFTKVEPSKISDGEIRYGPYENVPALSYMPITAHFENNEPFAVVKELEREIEISHWGNIYITEKYHLTHAGARHKGGFSRFDYQSKPSASGASSFRHLLARLPPRAHSVYYRDEIGNISTSHLRSDLRKTELELEPRYPLFGGWQVTFTIGYGIPLQDFVFKAEDGRRFLNITFGSPFVNVVVDNLVVKVVLPEGSTEASATLPFAAEEALRTKYTYLDTVGRPVVELTKKNVVPEHNVHFQVHYRFSSVAMLAEPLLLVVGFFAFFGACIAYTHFDFSISKSSSSYQARQQREEVLDAVQRIQKVMNERAATSDKLEASLRDLARTGNVATCKAARKEADAKLKDTNKDLKAILDSLPASSRSTVLAKVDTLMQKEREKQEKLQQKHTVTVEAYEKKLSSKEIDSRVAPYQQKLTALKQEVAELFHLLDD